MSMTRDEDGGLILCPSGLFDYAVGTKLVDLALENYPENGQITIDFRQVKFMDSSGIGALISLYRKIPGDAPKIRLIHPSDMILKLMQICNLHRMFVIEERPEEES